MSETPFITVKLIGSLGKKFTREIKLKARNASQVIKGLCANFSDFKSYVADKHFIVFRVNPGDSYNIGEEDAELPLGESYFVICPAIKGSGGFFRILTGVALVGLGFLIPGAGSILFPLGGSLILGGIAQLLTPLPTPPKEQEREDSFLASVGTGSNPITQPVPILYGGRYIKNPPTILESRTVAQLL